MKSAMKFLSLIFTVLILTNTAYAESPREQLKQMVEQLQQSPTDDALRERIIKLARTVKPAIPEEAERHMAYGTAAFTGAKSVADYQNAAKEFEQATLAAPWYGDAYFNLGVVQDKAENYEAALRNLKLALLASPNDKEIKALLYQVEYRNKKLAAIRETEAEMRPGKVFRDCTDCPEMVGIPAGSIGPAFAMGKTEVTQGQWKAIMGNNPSDFKKCGDNCPVEEVSWVDVHEFIQKLNTKTGKQYRLPTEAEWEYACRAGIRQDYCGSDSVDSVAWYKDNSGGTTHPVAGKQSNAYGLYDMSGNVWEWVEDCYNGDCAKRVYIGGGWNVSKNFLSFAYRAPYGVNEIGPDNRGGILGLRVARTLP